MERTLLHASPCALWLWSVGRRRRLQLQWEAAGVYQRSE